MLHIPLLIISSTIFFIQPIYSMEHDKKEKKHEHKLPSLPLRKKSGDNSSPKQKYSSYNSNDQDHIPSISLTTSSTSTSPSPDVSLSQSSKQTTYGRSKTVDTTPTQPKEHHKFNIFSHSESADKEKTPRQKGYGRSKTVDSASPQPREPFKLKLLSVSDGTTSSSSFKISPRSKLISSAKNTPQANKISPLINAVKNYDLDTIEQYCNEQNANLNQTDQEGNTALHHAVIKLTEATSNEPMLKKFIQLFLENPQTDTSIVRHKDNRTASQILLGGQNPEMRALLFARLTLDMTTNQEISKMLIESYIYDTPLDDNLIKKTAKYIRNKIQLTEKKQGGSDLPQDATLPNYATDEFILKMIEHRIPQEAYNVSEFQKIILREIFFNERDSIILLTIPMDFYDLFIEESIQKILEIIDAHYNYLNKLITKPYIFEMLKTYIKEYNVSESQKSSLKEILCKERDSIILLKIPMNFDHPLIQESIERILAFMEESIEKILVIVGHHHHNSLKKIMTKTYIFEILKAYVEKQNEENKPKDFFKFYSQNNNNNNNNH